MPHVEYMSCTGQVPQVEYRSGTSTVVFHLVEYMSGTCTAVFQLVEYRSGTCQISCPTKKYSCTFKVQLSRAGHTTENTYKTASVRRHHDYHVALKSGQVTSVTLNIRSGKVSFVLHIFYKLL